MIPDPIFFVGLPRYERRFFDVASIRKGVPICMCILKRSMLATWHQVVLKLFHIVEPDVAVFGKKDFQQLRVLQRMVRDLDMAIDVIGGEIGREEDGLAMSRCVGPSMLHRTHHYRRQSQCIANARASCACTGNTDRTAVGGCTTW